MGEKPNAPEAACYIETWCLRSEILQFYGSTVAKVNATGFRVLSFRVESLWFRVKLKHRNSLDPPSSRKLGLRSFYLGIVRVYTGYLGGLSLGEGLSQLFLRKV